MKYKLIKDTPQLKQGVILKKTGTNYVNDDVKIPAIIVESKPEWFAPVSELIYVQPYLSKERQIGISVIISEGYDGDWTVEEIYEDLKEYIDDTFNNPKL